MPVIKATIKRFNVTVQPTEMGRTREKRFSESKDPEETEHLIDRIIIEKVVFKETVLPRRCCRKCRDGDVDFVPS